MSSDVAGSSGGRERTRLTSAEIPWLQISSDSASYKLYYVNYKIWLDLLACLGHVLALFLLLVGDFPKFMLREFVVDVLLEQMRIGAHDAPPIHEDRRCAVHL